MKVHPVPDDTSRPLEDDRRFDDVDCPRPAPTWQAWVETAALAALATVAGIFADLGQPWLALAPLLVGLRYGSCLAVACAAAQAGALTVAAHWRATIAVPAAEAVLGWLVAGMVTGQFRDAWTRRLRGLEMHARDTRRRLGSLARAYHLLSASHDRLQREIPGSPSSLRDALESFARELVETDAGTAGMIESQGGRILTLFRVHASVRAATLHRVDAQGRFGPALAALGTGAARADDPLICQAVRLGEVVSVRELAASAGTLVAVPLVDVAGRVHAVVAVRELPFLCLHQDTLTLFAVLGGQLGDLLAREVACAEVEAQPTRAFCASVSRSLREARRYGIPAALALVELEALPGMHRGPRLLARCLAAHRRVTDQAEIVADGDGTQRIVILLKLAPATGLRSYLARLDELARSRARELGTQCHIRMRGWSLDDAPLPIHPRELESDFATWLKSAASSSGTPASRRHHGVMA